MNNLDIFFKKEKNINAELFLPDVNPKYSVKQINTEVDVCPTSDALTEWL